MSSYAQENAVDTPGLMVAPMWDLMHAADPGASKIPHGNLAREIPNTKLTAALRFRTK
jgi:hypothetical protein